MPWYRKVQLIAMTVAVIAVSRMGWEFFVNDIESLAVIEICGYGALVALYVNLFAALYRLVKEWKNKKYKLQAGISVVRVEIKLVFFLTMQY